MKKLELSRTANTPSISLDPETGIFKLEGRSIPENPGDFFDGVFDWLNEYFNNPAPSTKFEINLEYVNSGSSKYLLGLFRVLKNAYNKNNDVRVIWYFEEDDETIQGLGEHFKSVMGIPFELVQYI